MKKYYITGTKRGLGKALQEKYGDCHSLKECDIFINCKHNGFEQVEMLYRAAELNKKIINIGSAASDWTKGRNTAQKYAVYKNTLKNVNEQLFYEGHNTSIINLGYFDSERSADIDAKKMSIEYVVELIDWIINQPHRIKELTVLP